MDGRGALHDQKAAGAHQEKGFEPEQFYRMDAEMHAIWFRATDKMKLWDMIQAPAASLYPVPHAGFCHGNGFYQNHPGTYGAL